MRLIRFAALTLLSVLLAGGAAAVALSSLLDWSRYRTQVSSFVSARIGHPVRIAGPIGLSLLPEPVLTAGQVEVTEPAGGGALSVENVRMQVALWPLLAGHIEARALILRRPMLTLPWPGPEGIVQLGDWLGGDGFTGRVEDGTMRIGALTVTAIDAALQSDAMQASLSGQAVVDGRPWHVTFRLGREGGDGAVSVDAALDGRDALAGIGLRLTGRAFDTGGFSGRVMARGPDLSRIAHAPSVPFKAEGTLLCPGEQWEIPDAALDLGGTLVGARATADASGLRISAHAYRLGFDRWAAALVGGRLPSWPIRADLALDAVTSAGTLFGPVHAVLETAPDALLVPDATIGLPGRAEMRLSGRAPAGEGGSLEAFQGHAALTAPDLPETLRWVRRVGWGAEWLSEGGSVPASASLAADVLLRPEAIALNALDGHLGNAAIGGAFAVRAGEGVPTILADLALDRLDLRTLPQAEAASDWLRPLGRVNGEAALRIRDVRIGPVSVGNMRVQARLADGRLDLPALAGTWNGIAAEASGWVDAKAGTADLLLRGRAESLDAAAMALGLPPAPLWHGPASLMVVAKGGAAALGTVLTLEAGDARLDAQPTLDLPARTMRGAVTLRHPSAWRLLQAAGIGSAPGFPSWQDWLDEGSLALIAQISAQNGRWAADSFDLTAGTLHASGALDLTRRNGRPVLEGRLGLDTLHLAPIDPALREPLPFAALAGWDAAVRLTAQSVERDSGPVAIRAGAEARLENGALRLDGIRADLPGGGTVTGTLAAECAADPPTGSLALDASGVALAPGLLPLLRSGRASASVRLETRGYSPATLLAMLRGTVTAEIRDGTVAPFGERAQEQPFTDAAVTGDWLGTTLRLPMIRMTLAEGGSLAGSGTAALDGAQADLRLRVLDEGGAGEGTLLVSGPVGAPTVTFDRTGRGVSAAAGPGAVRAPGP